MTIRLLTPPDIRALAEQLQIRPTKTLGQNFVHDAGTVRAIAASADIGPGDHVVEVGPGLGSLTLALLETGAAVSAVEIDPTLAEALPATVARFAPDAADRFAVTCRDALSIESPTDLAVPAAVASSNPDAAASSNPGATAASSTDSFSPTHLVANLPYNVAVPILLTFLANLPTLKTCVIMVQAEVADRIAAEPGSRIYGVPSVKTQWYGTARRTRTVGRKVFWPVPNVDSAIVRIDRHDDSRQPDATRPISRTDVFAIIDAAFAQRRKTLRAALAAWAGSPAESEAILTRAGIDPKTRGEQLRIDDFIAIAHAAAAANARTGQRRGTM
ncbi:16S rRNA (adenine(1518)-N(6)/adenine(1519)-N(6))-dimethyltransferase [Bowdeniella nasicola]|uniref:Ribosomal RNA small subunit methyltransferase A n=1 Tax=Bowdeniella nasicola TaxID=208480 RepID=A0A1Q5Q2X8_9ACTO|nr:16S rRNA (adenine(1518)-N(6)/adenine(1519)-N(6))-dimethyltransferase RsmA [Bowdeniella nasicola]OKL54105.1 16S rRNA (adenine(1518)-N(6)/adenine(1519)-N(6))-dimethyltransferase [Bowdeniella nasicola]